LGVLCSVSTDYLYLIHPFYIKMHLGLTADLFLDQIQCAALSEPLDLIHAHSVLSLDFQLISSFLINNQCNRFSRSDPLNANGLNYVSTSKLFIVILINKCQWKNTLLLKVCFVNTGKGSSNDQWTSKITDL
jgi:hypothetical protein